VAKKRHLIVGSGAAGLSALRQIRSVSGEDEIRVVTLEDSLPYSPTALPYLLYGKIEPPKLWTADRDLFLQLRAELVLGRKLIQVIPEEKVAVFEGGNREEFDTLLIATGSKPLQPSIKGMAPGEALVFHTLRDLQALDRSLEGRKESEVLIYGGGLVAMGVGQALIRRGIRVKVVVRSRVLRRYFDLEAGTLIDGVFSSQGAEIIVGSEIDRVEKSGNKVNVHMGNGRVITGDLLINALGTTPRISFLERSGIAIDAGILVDQKMRTNKEHIYAAGDVAVAKDFFSHTPGANAILPSAVEQGKIAGSNMAGADLEYEGWISMNVFHFFGKGAYSIGVLEGNNGAEVLKDGGKEKGYYTKLAFREGRLSGAAFVNVDVDPGVILYLIKNRLDIGKYKNHLLQKPGQISRWLMARNERE